MNKGIVFLFPSFGKQYEIDHKAEHSSNQNEYYKQGIFHDYSICLLL